MKSNYIKIIWPNGETSFVPEGSEWLEVAHEAGFIIPTGCLGGSCGACEIDVNGETIRACVNNISSAKSQALKVSLSSDPYW
tara:strand:- start:734 stop:979 length:246 start_codon:yes stop_codon:yes gene_type:complete